MVPSRKAGIRSNHLKVTWEGQELRSAPGAPWKSQGKLRWCRMPLRSLETPLATGASFLRRFVLPRRSTSSLEEPPCSCRVSIVRDVRRRRGRRHRVRPLRRTFPGGAQALRSPARRCRRSCLGGDGCRLRSARSSHSRAAKQRRVPAFPLLFPSQHDDVETPLDPVRLPQGDGNVGRATRRWERRNGASAKGSAVSSWAPPLRESEEPCPESHFLAKHRYSSCSLVLPCPAGASCCGRLGSSCAGSPPGAAGAAARAALASGCRSLLEGQVSDC